MQAVFWHLVVTHPRLLQSTPRWESVDLYDGKGTPGRVLNLPS
jgi:hypothetical protein